MARCSFEESGRKQKKAEMKPADLNASGTGCLPVARSPKNKVARRAALVGTEAFGVRARTPRTL
jgi:hypothetical protein